MKTRAVVAALAGAIMGSMPGAVAAQNSTAPYGCACLNNTKVDATIKYRFRWGNGDWNSATLPKGRVNWMCWTYKDAPKSPELQFQLDVDLTASNKWETFAIKRSQARERSCSSIGAQYHVGYVSGSNRKKIQIYNGKS